MMTTDTSLFTGFSLSVRGHDETPWRGTGLTCRVGVRRGRVSARAAGEVAGQPAQRPPQVVLGGPWVERAQPQDRPAVYRGGGQGGVAVVGQRGRGGAVLFAGRTDRRPGDDAELGG